jgi:hypothetical protein
MLSRRAFVRSAAAYGALAATGCAPSWPAPGVTVWEPPSSIDITGARNVSAALTYWLATTGKPGDVFRLRRGPRYAPGVYWIPQGILINKPLTLDLNGCWLQTGLVLGDSDPNFEQNKTLFPSLWPDHQPGHPQHRWCVCVGADDVTVTSSLAGARIQGAGRLVRYRGGNKEMPEGLLYTPELEDQAAIVVGLPDGTADAHNTDIDLSNIALEYALGDGVTSFPRGVGPLRIHGRTLGPDVVNANIVNPGGEERLGAAGGLGGTIVTGTDGVDRWQPTIKAYPGIHHTGRHGYATDWTINDLTIEDLSVWRVGRAFVDLELAGPDARARNVVIRRCETGHAYLNWIVNGAEGSIENFVVEDNIAYTTMTVQAPAPPGGDRGTNWRIRRNRGQLRQVGDGSVVLKTTRVDGLTIVDNYNTRGPDSPGIELGTSTAVTIAPTEEAQFPIEQSGA